MPFQPPPAGLPLLLPKDAVADYLEDYAERQGAEVLLSASVKSAAYDPAEKRWSVKVEVGGETRALSAPHFVIACGFSGFPHLPAFPGGELFAGRLLHSSAFGAAEAGEKTAVVVGANTSAHDVAQSLTESGVRVTMVQRSPTTVVSIEAHTHINMAPFTADLTDDERRDAAIAGFYSQSYKRIAEEHREHLVPALKEKDAGLCERLNAAGFRTDWGEDESGLVVKFLRRGTGCARPAPNRRQVQALTPLCVLSRAATTWTWARAP